MKRWKDPLRVAYFHQQFQTSICTTSSTYGSRNVFADSLGEKPTWFVTRTITSSVFNTKMRQKPSTRILLTGSNNLGWKFQKRSLRLLPSGVTRGRRTKMPRAGAVEENLKRLISKGLLIIVVRERMDASALNGKLVPRNTVRACFEQGCGCRRIDTCQKMSS